MPVQRKPHDELASLAGSDVSRFDPAPMHLHPPARQREPRARTGGEQPAPQARHLVVERARHLGDIGL